MHIHYHNQAQQRFNEDQLSESGALITPSVCDISPEASVADPSACDRPYATDATTDPEIINKQDPNASNVAMSNCL